MTAQNSLSVILLGLIAPATSVGLYQVAHRIAALPTYAGHGFLMGWVPFGRAAVSRAAKRQKGKQEYESAVFTLFALLLLGLVFVTSLGADVLVRLAAPEYASAADLIPLLTVAAASNLVFIGIYRAVSFPTVSPGTQGCIWSGRCPTGCSWVSNADRGELSARVRTDRRQRLHLADLPVAGPTRQSDHALRMAAAWSGDGGGGRVRRCRTAGVRGRLWPSRTRPARDAAFPVVLTAPRFSI